MAWSVGDLCETAADGGTADSCWLPMGYRDSEIQTMSARPTPIDLRSSPSQPESTPAVPVAIDRCSVAIRLTNIQNGFRRICVPGRGARVTSACFGGCNAHVEQRRS